MKWSVALSACCVVLLAANIALLHQNRQLKAQISLPPPTLEAAAGAQMPDLRGFDPEANRLRCSTEKTREKSWCWFFLQHALSAIKTGQSGSR